MSKMQFGLGIVTFFAFTALLAPWLAPDNPNAMALSQSLEPPSQAHLLGRDENGSDVLSRLIYGCRISLGVAMSVSFICGGIGLLIGSWSAYLGGWTDKILMRFVDVFLAFPGFLIALAMVAVLGPSLRNLILALCLTSWASFARLVRGEVLHLKTREYVLSAQALGVGHLRLVVLHIWPNLFSLLMIQVSFVMASTLLSEAGLSFLGLGVPPGTPTWGSVLNSGRRVLSEAPHISFAAGFAIMSLVCGFNLLADGLREFLDPRRGKGAL